MGIWVLEPGGGGNRQKIRSQNKSGKEIRSRETIEEDQSSSSSYFFCVMRAHLSEGK
ncbi:hypothetical protein HanRHA438_Chr10g0459801 [Helianthus annuus]|nr:hypothetical protein HanRHA438_Chr10g0459801 [Helianthus annuus]